MTTHATRTLVIFLAVLSLLGNASCQPAGGQFVPIGIGGGGGLFAPAASPHDPNLMFVSCDMGGFYRSEDAGRTWLMLDKRQLRGSTAMCPVFDPRDANVVYAWGCGELRVSRDKGLTWRGLTNQPPWSAAGLTCLTLDRDDPKLMLAGGPEGLYVSQDGGVTWAAAAGVAGPVTGLYIAPGGPVCFAAGTQGVFRSADRGATWQPANTGLPATAVRGLCGARDPRTGETLLYCTVPSRADNGQYVGGVYKSSDLGVSWQSTMGEGLNRDLQKRDQYGADAVAQYSFLDMDESKPKTVWVTTRGTGYHPPSHWTVFRSDDAGATWHYTFTGNPQEPEAVRNVRAGWIAQESGWGWGGPPLGFSVCSGNAEVAMYTNAGELFITTDGGRSWYNGFCHTADGSPEGKGNAWASSGLNVTTCWDVAFDPFRPGSIYISYTDIGFARSEDRGKSWALATEGSPWPNTCYRVICDPAKEGVLYAAWSNQHDIPEWTSVDGPRAPGGVCISTDFAKTWRPISEGLPQVPCTSVALDPRSPPNARVLYAAMFGDGVYKSVDGGATWRKASEGLGQETNKDVYSVRLHPDGTLLCSVTGKRTGNEFATPSGLYRSRDGGATWQGISGSLDLRWAGDFDFDPNNSAVIYLTAAAAPGHSQGGIYKTTDGGATWRQLLGDGMPENKRLPADLEGYVHAFSVTVDKTRPDRVFLGAVTHGVFVSQDAGESWTELTGIPFQACQRVMVDPTDAGTIWVTSFGGGVWKGPAPVR
jgi:photosystem II stability/assembly factor-like uncharacterized protein